VPIPLTPNAPAVPTFPLLGDEEDLADGRRLVLRRCGEAEVVEDSPDRELIGEGDELHPLGAAGADERVDLVDLGDHPYAEFGISLIAKVFPADPLTCRQCGGNSRSWPTYTTIKQVLAHVGLSPPEEPKPPPAVHEVVHVPIDEEGREMEAP
jgi:hypothetical protein